MASNPLKMDPTRTSLLRRSFVAEMQRRFAKLKKTITQLIVTDDAFSLNVPDLATNATKFVYETSQAKIAAFRQWLQEQVDAGIIELPPGANPTQAWTSRYIISAYRKALVRTYLDVRGSSVNKEAGFIEGSQAAFLEEAFSSPIALQQVERLSTRVFENLKDIDAEMSQKLSEVLTDGFVHGYGPVQIARNIVKAVTGIEKKRALAMARTEIIHAYAEGQLDAFEVLGVDELGLLAEWSVSGFNVCPLCGEREGRVYTVAEARGLIPLHPNCRCAWIPYFAVRIRMGDLTRKAKEAVGAGTFQQQTRDVRRASRQQSLQDAIKRSANRIGR